MKRLIAMLCAAAAIGAAQDWPDLGRFREANATLMPAAGRVVFLGASMFELWGKKHGQFFPGKPYVNRGIGGQTTPQMLLRFRQDVLALRPGVVVIMGGGNDLAGNTGPARIEDIEGNLASMAEIARGSGIRVVLASIMPACDAPGAKRPVDKIREINAWMRGYAEGAGHVYLDWFTATVDQAGGLRRELTYDCLHPNDAGYAIMGPLAERAIAEAVR